jgi:hypothetical protein
MSFIVMPLLEKNGNAGTSIASVSKGICNRPERKFLNEIPLSNVAVARTSHHDATGCRREFQLSIHLARTPVRSFARFAGRTPNHASRERAG